MPAAGVPALALEEERRLVIDLLCNLMDLARIEPCIPYLPTEMQSSCAAYLSALVSPALSLLEGKVSVAAFLLKQLERAVNPARQVRALGQKWESRHLFLSQRKIVENVVDPMARLLGGDDAAAFSALLGDREALDRLVRLEKPFPDALPAPR